MLNVDDMYDPIADAPAASFTDVGDAYAGAIAAAEERDDKYANGSQVPVIVLQLDEPLDDEDYAALWVRSSLLLKEIAKAAKRAGRTAVTEGDWMRVELTAERESESGRSYKVYAVEYKRIEGDKKAVATGESVDSRRSTGLLDDEPDL